MNLRTEPYTEQLKRWPQHGRHILAQFDAETVVVYQAYRPAIGNYATQHQSFGGEFSFNRMSWIKPNFLWMMFRNGWGTKEGQEVTLAVSLRRTAFEEILKHAVHSSFVAEVYNSPEQWRKRLTESPVRLQWDPDHDPAGKNLERRAIQLGLSGELLRRYSKDWLIKVEDISDFVLEQRARAASPDFEGLAVPAEEVYPIGDPDVVKRLGIDRVEQQITS